MAAAGYYVFNETLEGGALVPVPNVTGLSITEASNVLAEKGLELGQQTNLPHDRVPKYHVIAQRPASGKVVRTGRKVNAVISMGASYQPAPDYLRKPLEDATSEINQSRFKLASVARVPHESPRNTVIGQDPPPGRSIENQGEIHLLVSAGSHQKSAFMPDIRGKSVSELLSIMAPYNAKLIPNVVDFPDAQDDIVLNQDPPADTLIYEGQVVTYQVKPSGSSAVPGRYSAEVRHKVPYDWFDRDVRVDIVDRQGIRQTVWTKEPLFDDQAKETFVAGSSIRIPVTYVEEATVEIYINDSLADSYVVKDGADPVRSGA
jgi:beta-lactam-binding protein with PASTA domain